MPGDFSGRTILGINISDFCGIYRAIAEKANIHGGNTLEGEEINLFYNIKNTIDKSKSIFSFEGQLYDANGELYSQVPSTISSDKDALYYKSPWTPPVEDFLKAQKAKEKNEKALQMVDEYVQTKVLEEQHIKEQHENKVNELTNSWTKTFKIKDKKEFKEFIERLYVIAKKLNITKTNDGTTKETFKPSEKYPTIEDQIIDEMCGAFANESNFDTTKVSPDGIYHGLFQFSQVGLNDVNQKAKNGLIDIDGLNLKPITNIKQFESLTRLEQLDYMAAYVLDCKKYYSHIGDAEIAPKNMYSMWHLPGAGMDPKNTSSKQKVITFRLNERDKINGAK